MSDKLSAAVEALQEELQKQLAEVDDTKRMINGLLRRMGQEALYADESNSVHSSTIRSSQFYGKPLATAAREYLEMSSQRDARTPDEILTALKKGAFDFKSTNWKEKDYLRMLSISLSKNTSMFHRLPNGAFGLLSWYDSAMIKRSDKAAGDAKKAQAVALPEEQEDEGDAT
ncbi:hypothetical protein [Tunturiibacter gelidiferens]|uniref:HTH HARE-type domain-containing protein n=1 Tax=Tunturiibacter gelidiferens TaxID=3069689 RepID=A0AAU7Z2Y5_9BACT